MSRIIKCICDGCGKEIVKEPIRIYAEHVDVETGDFITDDGGNYYWENQKDYCESCAEQIIQFIDGLPAQNAESEKSCPPPTGEIKTGEGKQKKPTIKGLLVEGKSDEEILQITGCTKSSISQIRYQMRKAQENEGTTEPEAVSKEPPKQTVMCSKVIKTCEFAGKTGNQLTCDYAIIVGHSRGCNPEECTAYRRKVGK